jgi:hypothetical protein
MNAPPATNPSEQRSKIAYLAREDFSVMVFEDELAAIESSERFDSA